MAEGRCTTMFLELTENVALWIFNLQYYSSHISFQGPFVVTQYDYKELINCLLKFDVDS